jgi:hypothetical protein
MDGGRVRVLYAGGIGHSGSTLIERLDEHTSYYARLHADERWRAGLPKAHQRTVTALSLPLLAGHGYAGTKS